MERPGHKRNVHNKVGYMHKAVCAMRTASETDSLVCARSGSIMAIDPVLHSTDFVRLLNYVERQAGQHGQAGCMPARFVYLVRFSRCVLDRRGAGVVSILFDLVDIYPDERLAESLLAAPRHYSELCLVKRVAVTSQAYVRAFLRSRSLLTPERLLYFCDVTRTRATVPGDNTVPADVWLYAWRTVVPTDPARLVPLLDQWYTRMRGFAVREDAMRYSFRFVDGPEDLDPTRCTGGAAEAGGAAGRRHVVQLDDTPDSELEELAGVVERIEERRRGGQQK